MNYSFIPKEYRLNLEESLSSSEKHLLDYISQHLEDIFDLSIVKLSEAANVSTATIVRTMKKIGFDGYTAFKHHLRSLNEHNPKFENIEKADKKIREAILKNEQEVIRTIQMIDSGTIEDAIQSIRASKRVMIFARGFSEMIASEMATKFQLMDKYCEFHNDPNIIRLISRRLKKNDIVLFISLNGETEELVEAARNCAQNGIRTIMMTANASGTLMNYATLSFVGFKSTISYFPDYEVRSRLPLQVIARVLMDAYAIRHEEWE